MPNNVTAKIVSARKRNYAAFFAALLSIALIVYGFSIPQSSLSGNLDIGKHAFNAELAGTAEQRTRGLSGRSSLGDNQAMLFVFDTPAIQCFWMKDMRFSIDILWFDSEHKLGHIERSVSPASFPHSFCPNLRSQYVVELLAGTADRLQLQIGDSLSGKIL